MVQSQRTVAEVTLTSEVDVAEVVKLRAQVSGEWEKQHGFKLSYTEVIVKAVASALREHPLPEFQLDRRRDSPSLRGEHRGRRRGRQRTDRAGGAKRRSEIVSSRWPRRSAT